MHLFNFDLAYPGAVLENLSAGRMGICQEATNTLGAAIVIATRYAAVRTQFASSLSSKGQIETPLIEYELHVSLWLVRPLFVFFFCQNCCCHWFNFVTAMEIISLLSCRLYYKNFYVRVHRSLLGERGEVHGRGKHSRSRKLASQCYVLFMVIWLKFN